MTVYKVKWKSYIADLYLPQQPKGKIVILLPGLPKSNSSEVLIKTFLNTGATVLYPAYSGSFDSSGQFSGEQCINDIEEYITWAQQSQVTELYFNQNIELGSANKIILVGVSFGALPALYGVNDRIYKLLLLSPALLFNQKEISEIVDFNFANKMDELVSFLQKAFPFSYRLKSTKLLTQFLHGNFSGQSRSQVHAALANLKIPTLLVHGKLDISVPWQISKALKCSVNNSLISWKFPKIGHSPSSYSRSILNIIYKFIE